MNEQAPNTPPPPEETGPTESGLRPGQGAPLVPGAPQSVGPPIAASVFNLGVLAYAGFGLLALIVIVIVLLAIFHH